MIGVYILLIPIIPFPYIYELSGILLNINAKLIITICSKFLKDFQIQGLLLIFKTGKILLVSECSGINSLIALISTAVLYQFLFPIKLIKRVLCLLLALLIPVISNSIRLIIMIILADKINVRFSLKFWHDYSSLLLYSISVILIISIVSLLRTKKK